MKKVLLPLATAFCALTIAQQAAAQNTTTRVPLFEVFTSSTCPPCKAGNSIYEGIVTTKPAADYVSIKYQQDFPGVGDPYGTAETISRRNYYAINSIPRMEIDGGWDENAQSFTNPLYAQYKAVPATYMLSGTYTIAGKVVTANISYTALDTLGINARLYVAVLEKRTTRNVKSNGETEFFNVVKKMLPNQSGSSIPNSEVGVVGTKTLTFTFPDSNRVPTSYANHITQFTVEQSVEDFKNLTVVAWIQGSDKKVYQAANLTTTPSGIKNTTAFNGTFTIYPVPAQNQLNLSLNMVHAEKVSVSLVNIAGQVVATQVADLGAGQGVMTIPTAELPNGNYTVIILDSKNNVQAQMVSVAH